MTSKRHFATWAGILLGCPALLRAQATTELEALQSIDATLQDVETKLDTLIVYVSDGNIQNASNLQSIFEGVVFTAACVFLFNLIYRAILER